MNSIKQFFVFLVLSGVLAASTSSIPVSSAARALARIMSDYQAIISKAPIVGWEQIESIDRGLLGINSFFPHGGAPDYFSFIPLGQRELFLGGKIVLVQHKPIPWPDTWKTEDLNNPGEYLKHRTHQDIRYLIYEKDGKFIAERWYESKFQSMLAETGLTVPSPTPYYPPTPTPPGEKPVSNTAALVITSKDPVIPAAIPTPEPAPLQIPRSFNPLWWVVGAIVALVAAAWVVRRKRPKN